MSDTKSDVDLKIMRSSPPHMFPNIGEVKRARRKILRDKAKSNGLVDKYSNRREYLQYTESHILWDQS